MIELLRPWALAISVASVVLSVLGILGAALVVGRLPEDALVRACRRADPEHGGSLVRRRGLGPGALWLARNALGGALVALGLAMLVLPGQGILTIALGLALADFPGRRQLLARVLSNPRIVQGLNRLRLRQGHPPFLHPPRPGA